MVKALAIVAHPDDETIWMGGTILEKRDWDWTIVSLCRKNDPDRAPKFHKVCNFYKAKGIISDLDDESLHDLTTQEVVNKIEEVLPEKEFDVIYTHGKNGEYGHKRHREIHEAVKHLRDKKKLLCKQIYFFSYQPGTENVPNIPNLNIAVPYESAEVQVNLSTDNFKKKVMLVNNRYGFGEESFEVLSCNKIEAFDKG